MLTACATPRGGPGSVTDLKPGERPPAGSDEAGLWLQMERAEQDVLLAGNLVRDRALNEYVRGIVCRLAGPHCGDVRVYIIRNAEFNAAMAPNGMMHVWTGLLLRTANEAQLAYVLGHEIGHYLRRHSLQRMRDIHSKSAFLQVITMVLGAGAGVAGSAVGLGAQLATLGSVYAFSRDSEREADELGFELMVRAGYDPREAPRSWERLLAERQASGTPQPTIFFATHPPTDERVATLRTMAEKAAATAGETRIGREDYLARLAPFRMALLGDEVRRRDFAATDVLLKRLIEDGVGLGDLYFWQGEMHRLRSAPDDLPKAIAAYRKALEFPDVPAETHRSLGIVLVRTGDRRAARDELARYLDRRPIAEDREMIKSQIADLER